MGEGLGLTITCATHKCFTLLEDVIVIQLLEEQTRIRNIYLKLITQDFVTNQKLMRWCPLADCSNAIKVKEVESKPVGCNCGHVFCFKCGENWHEPVTCAKLEQWLADDEDDEGPESDNEDEDSKTKTKELREAIENKSWIASNARKCPNCQVLIEKNGGCNHITCKKCNHHFCWVFLSLCKPSSCSYQIHIFLAYFRILGL